MKKLKKILLIVWGLLGALPAYADDAMAAANRFYAVYGGFHPSDGIPDVGGRARLGPLLSDHLNKLLADAARAGDRFNARNKGSPPLLEGDLFTSMFEGATSWKVGTCSGDTRTAHCAVALRHDAPAQKPVLWNDTLYLVATPVGWRVDDVGYGGGFAFGNTGKLSDTLSSVLTEAQ